MILKYVKWFDQISKDDVHLVGNKAANLGQLFNLKLPVPSGFVVTSKTFDRIMELNNLGEEINGALAGLDTSNEDDVKLASAKIQNLIMKQEFPAEVRNEIMQSYENLSYSDSITDQRLISLISAGRGLSLVAVRGSNTAVDLNDGMLDDQHKSFLNVKGKKEVIEHIKKSWASFYDTGSISYRAAQGFEDAKFAAILQRMVNADKSGLVYTADHTNKNQNMIVNSIWGLGEYMNSDELTADRFVIDKLSGEVIENVIGNKSVALMKDKMTEQSVPVNIPSHKVNASSLNDDELNRILRYCKSIENYFEQPQHIEFAIERSTIRILETKPLVKKEDAFEEGVEEKVEQPAVQFDTMPSATDEIKDPDDSEYNENDDIQDDDARKKEEELGSAIGSLFN